MRYVKPHYYDDFKCIADKCPDTCCAGWQIVIDDETLEKYEKCKDEFGARLKNSIDWQEGCFCQNNRRCAMLNENNLCDLFSAKGEDWLCNTCARYPRHTEEFDGVRELSLSLSCPVVAEMMLQSEEKVRFLVEEDEEPDPLEEEFEDFDFLLFTQLEDARNVMFSIVQNREISIGKRMAMITKLAHEMQLCVDESRLFDMEKKIARAADGSLNTCIAEAGETRYQKIKHAFAVFYELEQLRDEWENVLENADRTLYAGNYQEYEKIQKAFQAQFVEPLGQGRWEIFLEQILMFFLYTYFCGAVYDECIYSKVVLSTFSVCFIQEFVMCRWHLMDKDLDDKQMKLSDCIELAYRYAREVEHSDENLNRLEEWIMEEFEEWNISGIS